MFLLHAGVLPALRRVAPPAMAVLAAAVLSAGCSSRPDGTTSFIWSNDPRPYQVAAAPPRPVEVEDDGREAQVAPPRSIRREPDDPREPYSRNYGTIPPAPSRSADVTPAAAGPVGASGVRTAGVPDDLPPAFRRKLASALGED